MRRTIDSIAKRFRLRLRTRIYLGFSILVASLLGVATVGSLGLSVVVAQINIMDGIAGNANRLRELALQVETIRRGMAEFHRDGKMDLGSEITKATARAAELLKQSTEYTLSQQRRALFNEAAAKLNEFNVKQAELVSLRSAFIAGNAQLSADASMLNAAVDQLAEVAAQSGTSADGTAIASIRMLLQKAEDSDQRFLASSNLVSPSFATSAAADVAKELSPLDAANSPEVQSALPPVLSALQRYMVAFINTSTAFRETEMLYSSQIRPDLIDLQTIVNRTLDRLMVGFVTTTEKAFAVSSNTIRKQLGLSAVATVVGAFLALLVARSIIRPIIGMTAAMTKLAAGDVAMKDVPGRHNTDEIGAMARTLEVFRNNAIRVMASEANMSAVIENMIESIVMFSPDGRMALRNQKAIALMGTPEYDCAGLTGMALMRMLITPAGWSTEAVRDLHERLSAVRSTGDAQVFDIILPDSRSFTVTAEILPNQNLLLCVEDITARRASAARIYHLAHHDVLTDLPNRALFQERLAASVDDAILPNGLGVTLLMCDLDRFKEVNDTYGHPAGDELLRQVSDRLRATMRKTDVLARLGGDEFAIIHLSGTEPQQVQALAERIVTTLREPFDIHGNHVSIGVSVGISHSPVHATDPIDLLKRADLALYAAKQGGRNMFVVYDTGMAEKLEERRALEVEIRKALGAGAFTLHYQPQVDLRTRHILGFEALARWTHPERGVVPPSTFIPVAEESSLIVELGEWVLRTACKDAATWGDDITIAVNVATQQFAAKGFVSTVRQALRDSGLTPERLELEITETAMLNDGEKMLAVLRELRSIGVRLAIDDFGTGYSALSYLQKFPFDKIKIDQSFIRELGNKDESDAIVRAVTNLGANLGMTTVAEGIETEAQAQILLGTTCNEAQGYLFSRPIPRDKVKELLAEQRKSLVA